jgi:hypothetical protein
MGGMDNYLDDIAEINDLDRLRRERDAAQARAEVAEARVQELEEMLGPSVFNFSDVELCQFVEDVFKHSELAFRAADEIRGIALSRSTSLKEPSDA